MFGLIRKTLAFSTGTLFGVYLAQNYRLPDVGAVAGALVRLQLSLCQARSTNCTVFMMVTKCSTTLQYKQAGNDDQKK